MSNAEGTDPDIQTRPIQPPESRGSVPAGRGGADSGAADLVDVEGTGGSPDDGEQNDVAGVGPGGPAASEDTQTEPREDVGSASSEERVRGIVLQVRADLSAGGLKEPDVTRALAGRLRDAGIPATDDELESLAREVATGSSPTSAEEAEPGATA